MMSFLFALVSIILPQKPAIAYVSSHWPLIWTGQKIFYFISLINYSGYVLESMVQWNMNQKELFPFLQYFWDLVGYQMSFQQSWFTFKEES